MRTTNASSLLSSMSLSQFCRASSRRKSVAGVCIVYCCHPCHTWALTVQGTHLRGRTSWLRIRSNCAVSRCCRASRGAASVKATGRGLHSSACPTIDGRSERVIWIAHVSCAPRISRMKGSPDVLDDLFLFEVILHFLILQRYYEETS